MHRSVAMLGGGSRTSARTAGTIAGLVVSVVLMAACNDSNGDTPEDTGAGSPVPATTPAVPEATETPSLSSTATPPPSPTGTPAGAGSPPGASGGDSGAPWDDSVLTLRDGTWPVGDAGEVEFAVQGDRLELIEVRPAGGWTVTGQEVEENEIEVELERDNVDWRFEAEIDDGILEIEIDQDIEDAEPGRYEVGLAGVVEFESADGSLNLMEVAPNEGWTHTVDVDDDDEIEVDFRMGNVLWEFNADRDDGRIDVEIDFEIEGQYPDAA